MTATSGNAPEPLPTGKLPADLMQRLLAGRSTALPPEVRLGPAVGEDAAAIDVPAGTIVAASDPVTLTGSDLGRFAVLVNANDVAVTGVRPRWFLATVLLPPGATAADATALFRDLDKNLAAIDAHLVGGHTEVTDAVNRPVVVGQMLGIAEDGRFVPTGGVRPGDVVVQIGPAPVEAAAVLAVEAADRLGSVDATVLRTARAALDDPGISVVDAALRAAEAGAVALHDPTEGGLASGLHEMATASDVDLVVDRDAVLWFAPGVTVCQALGGDPWTVLASGTLLAAFRPEDVSRALHALHVDHPASVIAVAEAPAGDGADGRVRDRAGTPIPWPARDDVARLLGA